MSNKLLPATNCTSLFAVTLLKVVTIDMSVELRARMHP